MSSGRPTRPIGTDLALRACPASSPMRELRHVGRKRSGRERVHRHLLLRKLRGEDAGQVMHRGLRGGIGPCGFRLCDVPHDRAHVDDGRRPVARRRRDQHRGEIARQREKPGHVDAEHAVPRLPGKVSNGSAPVRPGVVDQDMQRVGALPRLGGQRGDAGFVGDRAAETLAWARARKAPAPPPRKPPPCARRSARARRRQAAPRRRSGQGPSPRRSPAPCGPGRKKARLQRSWLPASPPIC